MSPNRLSLPVRRLISILLLATFALPLTAAASESDPKAVKLAQKTLQAMGGQEAWEGTRFIRFNFFGFRTHHWDRYTGRHRLEGKSREGQSYIVLHNIDSREGEVHVDGERLTGEDAESWLERAYGAWVNDTYWLLMPYKLLDPGVHLTYEGEEEIDGKTYDKVGLAFDTVGLTPGDRYWAYLNRETGLMDRWAYHLQDWEADRAPTAWEWTGWERHGEILLAPKRHNAENDREAELADIAVFEALSDSVFTSSEPVADAQ